MILQQGDHAIIPEATDSLIHKGLEYLDAMPVVFQVASLIVIVLLIVAPGWVKSVVRRRRAKKHADSVYTGMIPMQDNDLPAQLTVRDVAHLNWIYRYLRAESRKKPLDSDSTVI